MDQAWRRFKKDRIAVAGGMLIIAVVLAAILAPVIVPYDPYEQFFEGMIVEGELLPATSP